MAREMDRPVQTFSVAFADRAFSELEYARQAARAIGADSHEIVINDDDFFGALPRLIWHEDEPIAHPSSVPLHFVSALARRHVKVVLTGEGSDELLAGYGQVSARRSSTGRPPASTNGWSRGIVRVGRGLVPRAETARPRRPHRAPIVPGGAPSAGGHVLSTPSPASRSACSATCCTPPSLAQRCV